LDERSAENVFELMQRLHASHHLTSVLATHNLLLAKRTGRVLLMERGKLTPATNVHADSAGAVSVPTGPDQNLGRVQVTRV
jgi:ABC-type lipoprotein export system ATPase subunit